MRVSKRGPGNLFVILSLKKSFVEKKGKKKEECFYRSNFLLPFTLWSNWEVARSLNGSRSIGRNQDSFSALVIGNFLFDFVKSPFRLLSGWSLSKRFQFRPLYFTETTNWDQLIFLIPCFYNGFSFFFVSVLHIRLRYKWN